MEKVQHASEAIVAPDTRYNGIIQEPQPMGQSGGRGNARIGPLAGETVLVTDFGSLVQLLALLDGAPVTNKELSSPKP
jgi:hypothetical protein